MATSSTAKSRKVKMKPEDDAIAADLVPRCDLECRLLQKRGERCRHGRSYFDVARLSTSRGKGEPVNRRGFLKGLERLQPGDVLSVPLVFTVTED